jgi:hypothetical protein
MAIHRCDVQASLSDGAPVSQCVLLLFHDGVHDLRCAATSSGGHRCEYDDNHDGEFHVAGRHRWNTR